MPLLVRKTLGNVETGEFAHRRELSQEVATELMIARPPKQRHQQYRNIAKRQINPNNNHRQKILE